MAYVFFPPRTSNFFPGGPPYLSGLGDYTADLAAYNKARTAYKVDHMKWLQEQALYNIALKKYNLAVQNIEQDYSMNMAAYSSAVDTYNTQYAGIKRANTSKSLTVAQGYGLSLPQSYYDAGACLTQAQHDSYARNCTTVKGLGRFGMRGLGSNDSDCGYAKLPICNYPVPPVAPTRTYPAKPTLRAEPKPPVAPIASPVVTTTPGTPPSGGGGTYTPPQVTPDVPPDATTPTVDPNKQASMVRNGLLLVAVLGGGYLVYRTLKKPKAQAA